MKYRFKLLELKRMRDGLMAFMESFDSSPKLDFDSPKNGLTMAQKLSLCAEITRLQKVITRIEAMPHGRIDDECGDFEVKVTSRFIQPTKQNIEFIKPYTFNNAKYHNHIEL